jgi:hypothetical protein
MKKLFWIIYAVIFIIVLVVGYFILSGLREENEEVQGKNEQKLQEINRIVKRKNDKTLPNKVWPDVYEDQLLEYEDVKQELEAKINKYNVAINSRFAGVSNELFDGEFKQKWVTILDGLLADGFLVYDLSITKKTVRENFETGNLSQLLGIPMTWSVGKVVRPPKPEERTAAEQQFWVQKQLISHFKEAEKGNGDWSKYQYKRVEEAAVKPVGLGYEPGLAMLPGHKAKEVPIPPPGLLKIEFKQYRAGDEGGTPFARGGSQEDRMAYKVSERYTDEYYFSAEFRMRPTSIPAFVNKITTDEDFFFVIDSINAVTISEREGGDKKIGWKVNDKIIPENEPPVNVTLNGRVLEFHFGRQPAERKAAPARRRSRFAQEEVIR